MSPTLATWLGGSLIGSIFVGLFALFAHDFGWREAAKGFLIVLAVVAVILVGATLLAWGVTHGA